MYGKEWKNSQMRERDVYYSMNKWLSVLNENDIIMKSFSY